MYRKTLHVTSHNWSIATACIVGGCSVNVVMATVLLSKLYVSHDFCFPLSVPLTLTGWAIFLIVLIAVLFLIIILCLLLIHCACMVWYRRYPKGVYYAEKRGVCVCMCARTCVCVYMHVQSLTGQLHALALVCMCVLYGRTSV